MVFGFFKSSHRRVAELVATMQGVDPKSLKPITEAAEWMEEMPEDDPRRAAVPSKLLKGRYYLFSNNREQGVVVRVTPKEVQVRLPFDIRLENGVRIPTSHLFRAMSNDGLIAMGDQRAQKVIRKVLEKAGETFREHQRMCNACYKIVNPVRYPGHPNTSILGPPAFKFIDCPGCEAGKLKAAALAEAAAQAEADAEEKARQEQEDLRLRNQER
ncbi:MAG: hypothetical protein AAFS10_00135 [Myxococcota bacterium]